MGRQAIQLEIGLADIGRDEIHTRGIIRIQRAVEIEEVQAHAWRQFRRMEAHREIFRRLIAVRVFDAGRNRDLIIGAGLRSEVDHEVRAVTIRVNQRRRQGWIERHVRHDRVPVHRRVEVNDK